MNTCPHCGRTSPSPGIEGRTLIELGRELIEAWGVRTGQPPRAFAYTLCVEELQRTAAEDAARRRLVPACSSLDAAGSISGEAPTRGPCRPAGGRPGQRLIN
jgi:hypothetical protein